MTHDVCLHEREFGQISEVLRRYDDHMETTNEQMRLLIDAVNGLKSTVDRQSEKLVEFGNIKDGLLQISTQMSTLSTENRDSLRRAHDRIDGIESFQRDHATTHCLECKNQLGCDEAHKSLSEFKDQMEPLVPVAKAFGRMREKILEWSMWVLIVIVALAFVVTVAKTYGVTPSIKIESKP